jgi:hypothetical protein
VAFERQGGVLQLLRDGQQGRAGLIEPQSLGQPVEQGRSAENSLERGNPPTDGRLAYAEGATGCAQRAVPCDRKKDAGVVPVEQAGAVTAIHDAPTYRYVPKLCNL